MNGTEERRRRLLRRIGEDAYKDSAAEFYGDAWVEHRKHSPLYDAMREKAAYREYCEGNGVPWIEWDDTADGRGQREKSGEDAAIRTFREKKSAWTSEIVDTLDGVLNGTRKLPASVPFRAWTVCRVMKAVAELAKSTGVLTAAMDTVATRSRTSRTTVWRIFTYLEDLGILKRIMSGGRDMETGKGYANMYHVCWQEIRRFLGIKCTAVSRYDRPEPDGTVPNAVASERLHAVHYAGAKARLGLEVGEHPFWHRTAACGKRRRPVKALLVENFYFSGISAGQRRSETAVTFGYSKDILSASNESVLPVENRVSPSIGQHIANWLQSLPIETAIRYSNEAATKPDPMGWLAKRIPKVPQPT